MNCQWRLLTTLVLLTVLGLCGCSIPTKPEPPMCTAHMKPVELKSSMVPENNIEGGYYCPDPKFKQLFEFRIVESSTALWDSTTNTGVVPPKIYIQTDEEFLEQRYDERGVKKNDNDLVSINDTEPFIKFPPAKEIRKVAVLDLKSDVATAGAPGRLAADMAYQALYNQATRKLILLDRNEANKALEEEMKSWENTRQRNVEGMSAEEQIKYLGNANFADFFVHGAVTQYSLENMSAEVPYLIAEEEISKFDGSIQKYRDLRDEYQRLYGQYEKDWLQYTKEVEQNWGEYEKAYQEYKKSYNKYLEDINSYEFNTGREAGARVPPRSMEVMPPVPPKIPKKELNLPLTDRRSVETLFLKEKFEKRMITVGNVGITLRLINNDGKIIWIGNAAIRSTNQQKAMRLVCDSLIRSMLSDNRCGKFLVMAK